MYIRRNEKRFWLLILMKRFVKEWLFYMIDVKCICIFCIWMERNYCYWRFFILRFCKRVLYYIWLNVDRWSLRWISCISCWRSISTECLSLCCCWRKRSTLYLVFLKDRTESTWSIRNWRGWISFVGIGVI